VQKLRPYLILALPHIRCGLPGGIASFNVMSFVQGQGDGLSGVLEPTRTYSSRSALSACWSDFQQSVKRLWRMLRSDLGRCCFYLRWSGSSW